MDELRKRVIGIMAEIMECTAAEIDPTIPFAFLAPDEWSVNDVDRAVGEVERRLGIELEDLFSSTEELIALYEAEVSVPA